MDSTRVRKSASHTAAATSFNSINIKIWCGLSTLWYLCIILKLILYFLQDSYPGGKYQVSVTIIDDGGLPGHQTASTTTRCLSAGITCATLALVHAGVQMYDLVIGLDADPSTICSKDADASLSVAVMPQIRQLTMINSRRLTLPSKVKMGPILDDVFERAAKMHASLQSMLFSSMEDDFNSMTMKT